MESRIAADVVMGQTHCEGGLLSGTPESQYEMANEVAETGTGRHQLGEACSTAVTTKLTTTRMDTKATHWTACIW